MRFGLPAMRTLRGCAILALALVAFAADALPGAAAELPTEPKCEFIASPGSSKCMLPFPDDYYTKADATSPTGRRIDFRELAMPTNSAGAPIEAAPYNVGDGFSPGSVIALKIPGIETAADVAAMHSVPINALGRYRALNAPIVVIDASTGARSPIWVEIDSTVKPEKANVEIHPAVNFTSGHRYIVALRNLKNAKKQHLQAPTGFRDYRDGMPSSEEKVNERRPHFEEIFSKLEAAGIQRSSLYLAWDFTVASDENNTGRELSMRNAAFSTLGDNNLADGIVEGSSPTFAVTSVENEPNPGEIARRVKGDVVVPCFLFPSCAPGGTMVLGPGGAPVQNGVWSANFDCIIPAVASTGAGESARPSLYGHGLFGDASEVGSGPQRSLSQAHDIVQCATDEIGMSETDLPSAIAATQNLSGFNKLTDRLQQGLLDELYLGRAMISPSGFTTNEAFHQNGTLATPSVLNTSHLYYNGNSQGGIMGGALTAISPDFTRASLGVPAINYSVLLPRSVDFDEFAALLYPSYPDEESRPLIFDIIQLLWDRGEPDGYVERMTSNPLPDTPAHQVLLDVAFGDHQVSDYQADVEARTIGASAHRPVLYKGRWPSGLPLWSVPAIKPYPYTGSAIYYWDGGPIRETAPGSGQFVGTEPPPFENLPNRTGSDPHGLPRATPAEQQLVSDFFEGAIQKRDRCNSGPCYSIGFTGP
ncbi:MAG: hypothetical protein QOI03_1055 [Solirubrobacteraceae bacterium]|jgi:hypothetical protein|nr:hypothetical protein [Solirubrobacteraceae bacterium]